MVKFLLTLFLLICTNKKFGFFLMKPNDRILVFDSKGQHDPSRVPACGNILRHHVLTKTFLLQNLFPLWKYTSGGIFDGIGNSAKLEAPKEMGRQREQSGE